MRDECGDWRIEGNRGHIYAVPRALDEPHAPGFQIYFGGEGVEKGWLNTKREMAFAKVMQDGDIDGCMLMGRLPTKAEAKVIRSRLAIPKRPTLSDEHRAAPRRHPIPRSGGVPPLPRRRAPGPL